MVLRLQSQVECADVADAMLVFAEGTRNRKVGVGEHPPRK